LRDDFMVSEAAQADCNSCVNAHLPDREPVRPLRRLVHPLSVFVAVQIVWIAAVVFWVYGFLSSHRRLRELAERYSPELLQGGVDWLLLAEGLVLLVVILAGLYVIFLYWQSQAALNREQKRLVSQVTHELRSPLASLQLYLETIRLRHPPPDKLDAFVDTMLEDTRRLNGLVTNLLAANRFEHRGWRLTLRPDDLSAFVTRYFGERQQDVPEGGSLEVRAQPGVWARFDRESLAMALRNLLENAVLYADGAPRIRVSLEADETSCRLSVADRGRGLDPKERKKVFGMFYRVRKGDETVAGSGLGLFIVRAVVLRHKGKTWIESPGPGRGTTVHVVLPRIPAAEGEAPR
jgi:signal transduction histidine kinase